MKIDFYEEFPSKENLSKLKLINFNSRVFLAAKSLGEFKQLKKQAKAINKKIECAYWPIIPNSYWISPFSNNEDLIKIFRELLGCKDKILIDLELPILNKKMFLKNILSFKKNKKLIYEFLRKNKKRVITAQFPSATLSWLAKILGLDYNLNLEKSFMWYSSMIPKFLNKRIKKYLVKLKDKSNHTLSLGTIAVGIFGNEPILSPNKLEGDLEFIQKSGFNRVTIFRLGGLNEDYIQVIDKFCSNNL